MVNHQSPRGRGESRSAPTTRSAQIDLGGVTAEVVRKQIKNVHLRVYPPDGKVRISAPARMDLDTIRGFAISKLDWIRRQQQKILEQQRETQREYVDGEIHYVQGRPCLLKVIEASGVPSVALHGDLLVLKVRPGADKPKRQAVLEAWYRDQLKEVVPLLIAKWEMVMNVRVEQFYLQRMKTRWGTCHPRKRSIRLNTDLARRSIECLEYVVVHEMAHLLVPSHNARFKALLDRYLPNWRELKKTLNQVPLGQGAWGE